MKIYLSKTFKKNYKKCPKIIQENFWKKLKFFQQDTQHPSLNTHKIKEKRFEYFSFYVLQGYRAEFVFGDQNIVEFFWIGPHDKAYNKK